MYFPTTTGPGCLPPSFGCPAQVQTQTLTPTPTIGCTTSTQGCGPIGYTGWYGCTQAATCPPQQAGNQTLPPPPTIGCPTSTQGCNPIGVTGWYGCQAPQGAQAQRLSPSIGCYTSTPTCTPAGNTGWYGCQANYGTGTVATGYTYTNNCPPPQAVPQANAPNTDVGCHTALLSCAIEQTDQTAETVVHTIIEG